MKNQLCITTFVFGETYQEYIPLYIYSILKSYKHYYPLILSHTQLTETVRNQLELLSELGEFKVVEGYLKKHKLDNQQGKAVRWILDEPDFEAFDAVYIGDIDIFILPEDPPLYEQHCEHCKAIGLSYSNALRPVSIEKLSKGMRSVADTFVSLGLRSMIRFLTQPELTIKRLTGLHFVKTAQYYQKVRPTIVKYRQLILDNNYRGRSRMVHHKQGFNNECLLYDMMVDAELGLPPEGLYSIDYRDYKRASFRPLHGIHLGMFNKNTITAGNQAFLNQDAYKEYYQKFCRMTFGDSVFESLLKTCSEGIRQQFIRIHQYYAHLKLEGTGVQMSE